jgi:hypothetical protein
MKKIKLALCMSAALFATVLLGTSVAQAQNAQWTATSSPVQATIAGGPWTLSQGGASTKGGAYDGPIPYCTPGNSSGGTPLLNSTSVINTMNPYYFPFVVGSGQNVKGYFDYRPKNINEAIVAATSTNAGQSWTFQQMAEQLTTECPNSDPNTANDAGGNPAGNDDGEGHATVISVGGSTLVYTLDRRTPHVDSDGLIVHQILPRGVNALNPLPMNSPFMQPPTANIIAGWNFNNNSNSTVTYNGNSYSVNNAPIPSSGTHATAAVLGMTNSYSFPVGGSTGTLVGSVANADVTDTTLSSDPFYDETSSGNPAGANNIAPNDNNAWRIRGPACTKSNSKCGTGVGNGWNTAALPCTQGAQFMVDTTGKYYIVLQFDWDTTGQGVRDLQVLYTTNGGTTWTPVGPIQVSGGGNVFNNQITINFHALGITSVENNPNFGVQLVSVYDPDYLGSPAYSIPAGGNVCSSTATGTYTAATLASNNQPVQYNNNSGNWRFDEVNFLGTANNTNPITSDPIINTTGLVNPDGILAVVPNTHPIEVLYISKTLNSDYVNPTSYPLCPASIPNGNFNDDVEVVRIATTSNFVNFTDITPFNTPAFSNTASPNTPIQMVNGLSDPSTTSYSGIRWPSPNGTLIQLSNGNWGLFFGGGNCLDGDSDGFHAIMYAESNGSDLTNWTVINGINNPIVSIAQQTGLTDPQTGATNVTIPSTTPVIGQSVAGGQYDWFSGRVYGPQAIVTSTGTVSLVFSGYNAGFQLGGKSRDYSNYRNIGQVNLQVTNVTLP